MRNPVLKLSIHHMEAITIIMVSKSGLAAFASKNWKSLKCKGQLSI